MLFLSHTACPALDADFSSLYSGANLKGVDMEGSQMTGINLRVATLKNAKLKNCNLRGATLAGTDLEVGHGQEKEGMLGRSVGSNFKDALSHDIFKSLYCLI